MDRFQAVVESAPIGMAMIDSDGQIVLVNAETEKLFGYTREELLNQPIELLVPRRFRSQHAENREAFFEDPTSRRMDAGRDIFGLRKDGSEFPVEIGLNPVETKDGMFVLSAIVDITQRKRMEDRFRATIESAPTAMVMIGSDGQIVLVNSETEKLFGYNREELLSQPIEVLVPERFRPQHPNHRKSYFVSPTSRRMGEGRDLFGLRKDGSEFPVEIGLNPVETEEGLFVLSAIVDITQRKRLEDKVRLANEALAESNIELSQFAYIASHDLQAPLRGVSSFARFLQQDYKGKLDQKADEYIDRIVNGCNRMQTMIRDLLEYSRIESRSRPFEETDLGEVFDDAVTILQADIQESGGRVTRGELPTVTADRSQLVQLFQNLISNGLKYHGDDPPLVQVTAEQRGTDWTVIVRDNGIGIKSDFREQVFDIFRRLHAEGMYPGTGIGLAICRRIVQRFGGRIWLESEEGKGTTFYFTLNE
jgi:PAS domain S-box-containing protein